MMRELVIIVPKSRLRKPAVMIQQSYLFAVGTAIANKREPSIPIVGHK